jgi:ribosomal 30S subunit maturation factor RimM
MAEQHIVTEDIDAVLREGLAVYAAGGEKIGSVKEYSPTAGYLVVQTGLVAHKDLYVPYSVIGSIDPRDVYLTLDKATLAGDYTMPPPATIVVEGETARTIVPSGYDGSPAEFNQVNLKTLRRDLARGMPVYASNADKIGSVDGIDRDAGYILVKKSRFDSKDFVIPFAAIGVFVLGEIYLAVSRDVVLKEYAQLPRDAVLRVDVMGAPGTGTPGVVVVEQEA